MEPINVVFGFDANYAHPASVSIYSLYANSKHPLKIYCLVPKKDLDNIKPINSLKEKLNLDLTVIGADLSLFKGWMTGRLSLAAYIRLLIPDLVPEKRVIYLDSDTLIIDDLGKLFSLDLKDNLLGAIGGKWSPADTRVPIPKEDPYINSGVLLMDLDVLRQDQFLDKCRSIYTQYEKEIIWHDQCVLNKYAENKKLLIDTVWNYKVPCGIKKPDWDEALKTAKVLHFTMGAKPWSSLGAKHIKELWQQYEIKLKAALNA